MATPPDFSAGQILTAAQMNAVGLWLVKSETIGSAVSSVQVTDAFTSDFEAYRIIISGGTSTSSQTLTMTLGGSGTGYYWTTQQTAYSSPTSVGVLGGSNQAAWNIGTTTTNNLHVMLDINQPGMAKPTYFHSFESNGTTGFRTFGGFHNVATAYTSFTIAMASGSMTGGTIRIYGYKAA